MIKKRMTTVFLIVASSFPFAIIRNILLGRILTKDDMGIMSLLITIIGFVYPVALLGHHNAIIRFLSKTDNIFNYNWKRFNLKVLLYGSIITLIAVLVLTKIYTLSIFIGIYLCIAIIASMIGDLYKEIARSQGRYELSLILQKSERFILPIILVMLFLINKFEFPIILKLFGFVYLIYAAVIIWFIYNSCPCGKDSVPNHVNKDALFFWGLDLSLIVLVSIDKLFVAKFTSFEMMATYYTTFTIMRLYDLAAESLEYVLLPHSNRSERISLIRWVGPILTLSVLITIFYLFFGGIILNFLFNGKYNQGIHLIPWFCAVGVMRILYIVPSSIIGGRLTSKELNKLHNGNIVIMVFNIIWVGYLTYHFKATGAIIATLIVCCARVVTGYYILIKNIRKSDFALTFN
jgi:O-antigen/teichoic acid export membrane protein